MSGVGWEEGEIVWSVVQDIPVNVVDYFVLS